VHKSWWQRFDASLQSIIEKLPIEVLNSYDSLMLKAALSHSLQTPELDLPFLHKELKIVCKKINRYEEEKKSSENIVQDVKKRGYTHSLLTLLEEEVPYSPPSQWDFTFIDLFAGIGGFRIAFQNVGGKCIFSSEWDRFAQQTYATNFGEIPYGDIRQIDKKEIPKHDVLCAGFPCQPFSLAGVSKKNSLGRKHGFEDETQGTLFFDIKKILEYKRPKAFMLENVKNLVSHDKGRTFQVIRQTLEDELGYVINWKVVDGKAWVPQHRERIFIVGYDLEKIDITREEIYIPEGPEDGYCYPELKDIISENVEDHTIGPGTWETLKRHKAHHEKAGNGFGYGLIKVPIKKWCITRTISARYHKDGAEILIEQPGARPRRLTIIEAMQLQGYDPQKYRFPVSKTQAYRQIGNSVVVPAVEACAKEIAKVLRERG